MIDVWDVVAHSFWILGLSVLLATWSYQSWERSQGIADGSFRVAYGVGLVLFLIGMVATSGTLLERLLWGGLLVAVLVLNGASLLEQRRGNAPRSRSGPGKHS